MAVFNVGERLAELKKFEFNTYNIEGVGFHLIQLTDDLISDVKMCSTYAEMVMLAAKSGISAGRARTCDDEKMLDYLDELWGWEELDIDCEPTLRHQVGLKVCEISGLSAFVEARHVFEKNEAKELAELEEAERLDDLKKKGHIDGDGEIPDVMIDGLSTVSDESLAADAINNAAA
jgi:hypothetical protein